jgi:hypothetical protein
MPLFPEKFPATFGADFDADFGAAINVRQRHTQDREIS